MTENITQIQDVKEFVEKRYAPYAVDVVLNRAIPSIDGFKPSHRKILYTIHKMNLKSYTKSASVVGNVMHLNPHGDSAIYEALVRLTNSNESLLHPLIDGKGGFGKRYSKEIAPSAARYTNVRAIGISELIFKDINKNAVEFVPNYDNSTKEPLLLPTVFPNILISPNLGIAVGMASNIPSFNLKETCSALIEYIKNPKIDNLHELMCFDFPTGGDIIYDEKIIKEIFETGKGTFKIRSKYKIDEKNRVIDIYEIPYTTTVENIEDKIIELVKSGKIKDITDVQNYTDIKGLSIQISYKRNVDPNVLMERLFKDSPLEDSFSVNMNILGYDNVPKVMGIKQVFNEWLKFRKDCIKNILTYDIEHKNKELHKLVGLQIINEDLDKAIELIRNAKTENQAKDNLIKHFKLSEEQSDYISTIKLINMNKDWLATRIKNIKAIEKDINGLNKRLKNIKKEIIDGLQYTIDKYSQERKSSIIYSEDIAELTEDETVENYNLMTYITNDGYVKKVPLTSLRANSEQKLKDGDYIVSENECENIGEIIFISNMGNVYKERLYNLADNKLSDYGYYVDNMFELEKDEKILYGFSTIDFKEDINIVFENGKMARVSSEIFKTKQNRKKLVNMINTKSNIVEICTGDKDIYMITDLEKVVLLNTGLVAVKSSKNVAGNQIMKLKDGDYVNRVVYFEDINAEDSEYYRITSGNKVGKYRRKEDLK